MAWHEQQWWQKLVNKKEESPAVDVLKDLKALADFLNEAGNDIKELLPLLPQLQELEKELTVANDELKKVNLQTQAEIYDKILERYGFFLTDAGINGTRLKTAAFEFLKKAKRAGLSDLVNEKMDDSRWKFLW